MSVGVTRDPLRIVVLGTLASNPFAGMAWMHMQIAVGLRRLGHDVYYFETTSNWPYDPLQEAKVCESDHAVAYLARVTESFGLGDRWAYRRSYLDKEWLGMPARTAERLLASADLVLNVAGSTRVAEEQIETGRLVYFGTDPLYHEITFADGDEDTISIVDEHDDVVTYGENIGTSGSPVPPLPNLRARTRQPVLIDLWETGPPSRDAYTTVGNWRQGGREVVFAGERYYWSKDREFVRFLDVPRRAGIAMELATNLSSGEGARYAEGEAVWAGGVARDARSLLLDHGWDLADGPSFTTDPWRYRDYLLSSRGEFTVARDLHVRLRSGWFSERSACYLAAGRPVVTQDTGFGTVLPTGEGLFAFTTVDEAVAALEAIESDYGRHSLAAREIAEEHFRAETVLSRVVDDLAGVAA